MTAAAALLSVAPVLRELLKNFARPTTAAHPKNVRLRVLLETGPQDHRDFSTLHMVEPLDESSRPCASMGCRSIQERVWPASMHHPTFGRRGGVDPVQLPGYRVASVSPAVGDRPRQMLIETVACEGACTSCGVLSSRVQARPTQHVKDLAGGSS